MFKWTAGLIVFRDTTSVYTGCFAKLVRQEDLNKRTWGTDQSRLFIFEFSFSTIVDRAGETIDSALKRGTRGREWFYAITHRPQARAHDLCAHSSHSWRTCSNHAPLRFGLVMYWPFSARYAHVDSTGSQYWESRPYRDTRAAKFGQSCVGNGSCAVKKLHRRSCGWLG